MVDSAKDAHAKDAHAKDRCTELTSPYRTAVQQILREEHTIQQSMNDNGTVLMSKNLDLANLMLNLASNYMAINGIFLAVLKIKDEDSLNDARKILYKSIIYMEELVTSHIDAPYTEYEHQLLQIKTVSPAQRYLLIRKMGLAIQLLETAYGDNSKWRWAFVELEGRYATVAKNIMNIRDVVVNSSFESEHYEPTVRHIALIKKLLMQSADRYREKYELSTDNIDDFKMGITFLSALKRFNTLIGDQAEAVTAKKKLDTWNSKLAADIEKHEKHEKEED